MSSDNEKLRVPYFVVIVVSLINFAAIIKITIAGWTGSGWLNDYAHFWLAATKAIAGNAAVAYDAHAFMADLKVVFAGKVPQLFWVYPPTGLLIHAPFGLLPEFIGYLVFTTLSLLAFMWVVARYLNRQFLYLLVLAISPAVVLTSAFGQNGLWASACLLLIAFAPTSVAGIAAGILTIKPQLGAMVPLAFLAAGRWRAIFITIITAVLLAGLSLLLFGIESWYGFFAVFAPDHPINQLTAEGKGADWQLGAYVVMRGAGLGRELAIAGQVLVVLLSMVLVVMAYRKRPGSIEAGAILIACSYLATPYSGAYDLPALSAVSLLVYLREAAHKAPSLPLMLSALLAFSLPFLCFYSARWHLPIAPLVLALFAMLLTVRIFQPNQPQQR